jgi:hypothetical protein
MILLRNYQQSGLDVSTGSCCARLVVLAGLIAAIPGVAESANAEITAAMAERMANACVAYARAHRGAVNIWVYDRTGQVVHFERMDGAPLIGAPPGSAPPGNGLALPFGAATDPNAFDPANRQDVPVVIAGENVGRVRVAGMGAPDRACAEAAAAAAK